MSNKKQPFGELLGQYVFDAAAQFIDQADLVTQAKIIDLINDIHSTTYPPDLYPEESVLESSYTLPIESCESQLEKQWQEVLSKPTGKKKVKNDRRKTVHRLISVYQFQIDYTIFFIGHFQKLLKRTRKNIADKRRKVDLITHYQSIIDKKAVYLIKMQALQEKELSRLQY